MNNLLFILQNSNVWIPINTLAVFLAVCKSANWCRIILQRYHHQHIIAVYYRNRIWKTQKPPSNIYYLYNQSFCYTFNKNNITVSASIMNPKYNTQIVYQFVTVLSNNGLKHLYNRCYLIVNYGNEKHSHYGKECFYCGSCLRSIDKNSKIHIFDNKTINMKLFY